MAQVVGYQTNDTDYSFVNQAGQTIEVKAGIWSVLGCPSRHTVPGEQPIGTEITCPECGQ